MGGQGPCAVTGVPDRIREQLKGLPNSPGCYIMRDRRGEIIYVGTSEKAMEFEGADTPIIDLNGYLGKEQTNLKSSCRVLIINNEELWAGLLVDQVLGLKHFYDADVSAEKPNVDGNVDPYLSSSYQQNNDNWYVFSMETLARNPGFFQVSL